MNEKFTKITIDNEYGTYDASLKEGDLDLPSMCQLFEQVLRGAGYYFDGSVKIVDEDCETN
jgi:hypothetical protein